MIMRSKALKRRYGRSLKAKGRVEIYVPGAAAPVYVSPWTDLDAAERMAGRKRDEVKRLGWDHDVRVVPEKRR
jgi:hypothetical protein